MDKKYKKDFLEFVTTKETVPSSLNESTRKDVLLSFRKTSILTKFLFFQIVGAVFTLSFCPQFGIGFVEHHGIAHHFRMIGDWACAAFCGSLFLSAGMIVAIIGMKGEELWWVWRRYKYSFILLPPALWSLLMLTNISLKLDIESFSYNVIWVASALMAQYGLFYLRSKFYLLKQAKLS